MIQIMCGYDSYEVETAETESRLLGRNASTAIMPSSTHASCCINPSCVMDTWFLVDRERFTTAEDIP